MVSKVLALAVIVAAVGAVAVETPLAGKSESGIESPAARSAECDRGEVRRARGEADGGVARRRDLSLSEGRREPLSEKGGRRIGRGKGGWPENRTALEI